MKNAVVSLSAVIAIIFAILCICGLFDNNDHYDIVIKPGFIVVHTPEYKIDDHYICTPTKCIPRDRVKEIRVIKDCECLNDQMD